MLCRVSAAVAAAAIAAMLFIPAQSNARNGAGVALHGGSRSMVRQVRRIHFPLVHEHRHFPFLHKPRVPFTHHPFAHRHPFHFFARRHHRAIYGGLPYYGLPLTYDGDSAFYGSYYDPSDNPGPVDPPAFAVPPAAVVPVAGPAQAYVDRGGCRSESVAVPSPGGAEPVTITRC